ncbi:cell wall-binding repeat-containing protein [Microterricola viridarii]|uniref:cell wall-binding repeat-containing protein n=1 Tax=Microterricola viridarii TaxID=412690 RepID=UPI0012EA47F3|nr:cell wall-binding repeat-containing protein [Microterricola viridarii]
MSLAPVGAAFAEDGIDWTSVQPDEVPPADALVEAPVEEPAEVPAETPSDELDGATDELGVEPDLEADLETAPQARTFAAPFAAAVASSFDPGNIISDYNFFDSWAMTEGEIQTFLDRNIAAPCENSNCLNVLKMNTPNASWTWGTCAPYAGAANESAARIIYKVQRACGLSAKVILVTLQKEQSLVTRNGPSSEILRKAMGMGCPDTDVCDSQYYGFFNQVYAAARQIVWYTNPDSSMFKSKKYEVGQVKPVQLHPNAACGAPGVRIANVATAAMYHYTPYQPNGAALAAGWGASGDPCSSYGNRNFSLYYTQWFGSPTGSPSPSAQRIAGTDRYDTAAAISRSSFSGEGSVPVAYVVTGEDFPDALAAGPAAASQGGPLLLTNPGYVPDPTTAELKRVKPKSIIVVGGPAAVSDHVVNTLKQIAPVTRIFGSDRYDTSRKVAQQAFGGATSAYVATGLNYPDALSASAAAGVARVPILLVNGGIGGVDAATTDYLKARKITSVKIVGGPVAVHPGVESGIVAKGVAVKRLSGEVRELTSVAINRDAFPGATSAYLATSLSFPDALAGSAAAARAGSPLYVTYPGCVTGELRSELKQRLNVASIRLLGGPAALNESIARLEGC